MNVMTVLPTLIEPGSLFPSNFADRKYVLWSKMGRLWSCKSWVYSSLRLLFDLHVGGQAYLLFIRPICMYHRIHICQNRWLYQGNASFQSPVFILWSLLHFPLCVIRHAVFGIYVEASSQETETPLAWICRQSHNHLFSLWIFLVPSIQILLVH